VSIQSVGIVPDIELDRVSIDKDKGVWLYRDWKGLSESELESHLTSKNTHAGDKSYATLKYLAIEPPKKVKKDILRDDTKVDDGAPPDDDDELDAQADTEDKFVEDFEIQYARDLVAQAKGWHRSEVLASSKAFFARKEQEEKTRIADAMKKLGVDWTPIAARAAGTPQPQLVSSLVTDKPKNEIKAGETIRLTGKITNKGQGTAGQVRAAIKADDGLFEGREFLFGRIGPGESKTFTVNVKIPKDALPRLDPLSLEVAEQLGAKATSEGDAVVAQVIGPARPIFSYAYQLVDDSGNGDGLAQKGESLRLHVTVRNIGEGRAPSAITQIRNLVGDGMFINKGRFPLGAIDPGQSKTVDFTFDAKQELEGNELRVELSVYDEVLHEYVLDKLAFPVLAPVQTTTRTGEVEIGSNDAQVYTGASHEAAIIGTVKKNAVLKETGTAGDFVRVELDGRPGYLPKSAVKEDASGAVTTAAFTQNWQVSPPKLAVNMPNSLVQGGTYQLTGKAQDEKKVSDVFVFVSNRRAKIDHRKVYYHSNRGGTNPRELSFGTSVPLWPGANVITVVARESTSVQSQETLIVERTDGTAPVAETSAK
jgi:carboxyl-terminal processing protease